MAILGIDEVGRGPLAGPLVIGAVILPENEQPWFKELKDSKKLTSKKREHLNEIILKESTTSLGWVSAEEIDKIGIGNTLKLATRRAVKSIQSKNTSFNQIIIDGNINFLKDTPLETYTSTIIKGDNKIREISSASIIAKVARDSYMINLAKTYPNYGFDRHVGYGTKTHIEAINTYGLTPEHRLSFEPCKSISGFKSPEKHLKNTTKKGNEAESKVANYLEKQGHKIIAKNHKTPLYEIDIISIKDHHIYFTEVKYRTSNIHGNGLESITTTKQNQMQFAAKSYLKFKEEELKNFSPLLAVASVSGTNYSVDSWFPLNT